MLDPGRYRQKKLDPGRHRRDGLEHWVPDCHANINVMTARDGRSFYPDLSPLTVCCVVHSLQRCRNWALCCTQNRFEKEEWHGLRSAVNLSQLYTAIVFGLLQCCLSLEEMVLRKKKLGFWSLGLEEKWGVRNHHSTLGSDWNGKSGRKSFCIGRMCLFALAQPQCSSHWKCNTFNIHLSFKNHEISFKATYSSHWAKHQTLHA